MDRNRFYEKLRTFFGYQPVPPTNDFRNPIWGSDDDDDGDELYTREQMEMYNDQIEVHREISKQMQDMFKSFGSIFGDMKSFFHHDTFIDEPIVDEPSEPTNYDSNAIRNYYLKPGYHNRKSEQPKGDVDLDGKISSHEISGLLKKKGSDGGDNAPVMPYGSLVPGRSFCRTIITTSVKKPDGTVETRRIIKNGNEVVEETTTSLGPDSRSPINTGLDAVSSAGLILAELGSLFKNFY